MEIDVRKSQPRFKVGASGNNGDDITLHQFYHRRRCVRMGASKDASRARRYAITPAENFCNQRAQGLHAKVGRKRADTRCLARCKYGQYTVGYLVKCQVQMHQSLLLPPSIAVPSLP